MSSLKYPSAQKTLHLVVPDWSTFTHFPALPLPFPLWFVGNQPLLHHWFDFAVNNHFDTIHLYTSQAPRLLHTLLHASTLWPLKYSVLNPDNTPHDALVLDSLPSLPSPAPLPTDPWSLLFLWSALEKQWFDTLHSPYPSEKINLSIGYNCKIHSTAKIIQPVWLGNFVSIGPHTTIGPYAVIGSHSLVDSHSSMTHSRLGRNTYLGQHVHLDHAYLRGHSLIDFKNKVAISNLDGLMGDSLQKTAMSPHYPERFQALLIWLTLKFIKFLRPNSSNSLLWIQRLPLFLRVAKGKLRLYGILPRTAPPQELSQAPQGVISFADSAGVHSVSDPRELPYACFQAVSPPKITKKACRKFLKDLIINALLYGE